MAEQTTRDALLDDDMAARIRNALDTQVEPVTLREIEHRSARLAPMPDIGRPRAIRGHLPWIAAAAMVVLVLGVGITLAVRSGPLARVDLVTPPVTANTVPSPGNMTGTSRSPGTDLGGGWWALASWPGVGDLGINGIGREGFSTIAAGNRVIVWGGKADGRESNADGSVLDVATNTWRPLPPAPLSARFGHVAVWTGQEMLLWGGTDKSTAGTPLSDGASYNPGTDTWRTIAASPLEGGEGYDAVWTGSEMVVVGGTGGNNTADGQQPSIRHNQSAAYDPATDTWRTLPELPIDLSFLEAHWTGAGVVVVGGQSFNGNGVTNRRGPVMAAALDPATGTWRVAPEAPVPSQSAAAAWTGDELLVVTYQSARDGSASWDPDSNEWTERDPIPADGCEDNPTAVAITGGVVAGVCGTIARYDPTMHAWNTLAPVATTEGTVASLRQDSTVFTGVSVVSIAGDGTVNSWTP